MALNSKDQVSYTKKRPGCGFPQPGILHLRTCGIWPIQHLSFLGIIRLHFDSRNVVLFMRFQFLHDVFI